MKILKAQWISGTWAFAALGLTLTFMSPARGQGGVGENRKDLALQAGGATTKVEGAKHQEPEKKSASVKEPVAKRVYQRNDEGFADIPIIVDTEGTSETLIGAGLVLGENLGSHAGVYREGKITHVPTGGPYTLHVNFQGEKGADGSRGSVRSILIGPIYVGDLWVLAGQSNMEGVGNLTDVTPASDRVFALGMDGKWVTAEEPLHWLVDSPDSVHSGDPADRAARSEAQHKTRTKGAGLGLPFAAVLSSMTGVPIGLVVCAHGGTSMAQWDPAKKGEEGKSLYGSMLRQIKLAGGKVRGVLWYQGESDANPEASKVYPKVFADFIAAVRGDLGQPELPFYFVQIGRFVYGADPKPWNAVQDAERLIPDRVANTAVVASVDLELDDLIHVGTPGLKRLGTRLARIALREIFNQTGATTPTLDRVNKRADHTLVLKFKGVNRTLAEPASSSGRNIPGGSLSAALNGPTYPPSVNQSLQGLWPARHIAGFSIRKEDGTEIPLIFDAGVGKSNDTVELKLIGDIPAGAFLWYGYGLNPYCNLTDSLDMAAPVFGPIPLDDVK